jgi:hypothetical protein
MKVPYSSGYSRNLRPLCYISDLMAAISFSLTSPRILLMMMVMRLGF